MTKKIKIKKQTNKTQKDISYFQQLKQNTDSLISKTTYSQFILLLILTVPFRFCICRLNITSDEFPPLSENETVLEPH